MEITAAGMDAEIVIPANDKRPIPHNYCKNKQDFNIRVPITDIIKCQHNGKIKNAFHNIDSCNKFSFIENYGGQGKPMLLEMSRWKRDINGII